MKKTSLWTAATIMALAMLGVGCSNPISLQSPNTATAGSAASRSLPANFRIVGYAANWVGSAEQINYDHLTNIIYAFAIPDSNGNIISMDNGAKLQSIVSYSHARGIKVSIAVGGWSYNGAELDGTFEVLAANASARTNLVTKLMALVAQYSLDGVDVDWEYPDAGTSSADHYTLLMGELSTALKAKGKLLSAAVCASGWAGNAVSTDVMNKVDFLNIMAYDGDAGAGHSPMSYATGALDFWITQRGLPAAKANLGVPFYARPSWTPYNQLVPLNPAVVPTVDYYNGDYYNGIPTIKAKTTLAMQRAGGIMIWELSQDTNDSTSLLSAIYATAGGGTNPTPTPSPTPTPTPSATPSIAPSPTPTASPSPSPSSGPVLATGVPGTPNIQQDNWDGGATYKIIMNMWWGNNGTSFELYENGVLATTVSLTDNSPNAQTTSVSFTNKAKGSYQYIGKLINKFGITTSGTLTYTVR